jgi:hypothetical protein
MKKYLGQGAALGVCLGAGLGVVMHNIPLWAGVGLVFGVVIGLILSKRKQ